MEDGAPANGERISKTCRTGFYTACRILRSIKKFNHQITYICMNHPTEPCEPFFQELLTPIDTHPSWTLIPSSPSIDEAVTRAMDNGLGELFYKHTSTRAQLHLRFPDEGCAGAMDGLLDLPLDSQITGRGPNGPFTGMLAAIHRKIADSHSTQYIEPASGGSLILTIHVPYQYEIGVWEETVTAVGRTAECVQRLHTNITKPLSEFDADDC